MDFQTDFLGLDNVYTYTAQQASRRRTSSISTTSTTATTSTSTASATMSNPRTPSPLRKQTSPHRRTHLRQSANLATDIDAGAVAAFGALRSQPRKPKHVDAETGSKSSTSAPIDIPPRQTTVRRIARTQHLKEGVWDVRRAMDAAGFSAHMNS